jgi:hypothetical protein
LPFRLEIVRVNIVPDSATLSLKALKVPKKWELKEISDSKSFGSKRVPGSGNHWSKPGDLKGDTFLVECKQTDKRSYSLNIDRWNKISNEALFSYRLPMMSLKIQDTELVVLAKEDWTNLFSLNKK